MTIRPPARGTNPPLKSKTGAALTFLGIGITAVALAIGLFGLMNNGMFVSPLIAMAAGYVLLIAVSMILVAAVGETDVGRGFLVFLLRSPLNDNDVRGPRRR